MKTKSFFLLVFVCILNFCGAFAQDYRTFRNDFFDLEYPSTFKRSIDNEPNVVFDAESEKSIFNVCYLDEVILPKASIWDEELKNSIIEGLYEYSGLNYESVSTATVYTKYGSRRAIFAMGYITKNMLGQDLKVKFVQYCMLIKGYFVLFTYTDYIDNDYAGMVDQLNKLLYRLKIK